MTALYRRKQIRDGFRHIITTHNSVHFKINVYETIYQLFLNNSALRSGLLLSCSSNNKNDDTPPVPLVPGTNHTILVTYFTMPKTNPMPPSIILLLIAIIAQQVLDRMDSLRSDSQSSRLYELLPKKVVFFGCEFDSVAMNRRILLGSPTACILFFHPVFFL